MQKLNGTFLFPGSRHQCILSKTLATTRGSQPLVAIGEGSFKQYLYFRQTLKRLTRFEA